MFLMKTITSKGKRRFLQVSASESWRVLGRGAFDDVVVVSVSHGDAGTRYGIHKARHDYVVSLAIHKLLGLQYQTPCKLPLDTRDHVDHLHAERFVLVGIAAGGEAETPYQHRVGILGQDRQGEALVLPHSLQRVVVLVQADGYQRILAGDLETGIDGASYGAAIHECTDDVEAVSKIVKNCRVHNHKVAKSVQKKLLTLARPFDRYHQTEDKDHLVGDIGSEENAGKIRKCQYQGKDCRPFRFATKTFVPVTTIKHSNVKICSVPLN